MVGTCSPVSLPLLREASNSSVVGLVAIYTRGTHLMQSFKFLILYFKDAHNHNLDQL